MSVSFYDASITPIARSLVSLKGILSEGQKFAQSEGLDEEEMLSMKLFDDMFDLKTQVGAVYLLCIQQGACLAAGNSASDINRAPKNFAGLISNVDVMLADIDEIDVDSYNQKMADPVVCTLPMGIAHFESAQLHMSQWVIPHLYFHVTTAYDILRNNGVALGKSHFLGKVEMRLEAQK